MNYNNAILKFEQVTGKNKKFHLKDINFEIEPGYICGLIGENGAGKTTLFKYIMDDECRYEGRICVDGEDIRTDHARIKNKIGYVSEDRRFFGNLNGKQNAEMLGGFYDEFEMELFLRLMDTMGVSCTKAYRSLSRGEKLKFQMAFEMAHKPCLYLLDEVTVGMDPVFRNEIFGILQSLIQEEKVSILMSSHITSEIQRKTDYVGRMKNGELVKFGESMDEDDEYEI